jgi:hypothetical protein
MKLAIEFSDGSFYYAVPSAIRVSDADAAAVMRAPDHEPSVVASPAFRAIMAAAGALSTLETQGRC